MILPIFTYMFFFFNDTATTEIYTLSLHDALPISPAMPCSSTAAARSCATNGMTRRGERAAADPGRCRRLPGQGRDRKSTRLNSSHANISYAVFCLKKKKKETTL